MHGAQPVGGNGKEDSLNPKTHRNYEYQRVTKHRSWRFLLMGRVRCQPNKAPVCYYNFWFHWHEREWERIARI